MNVALTHKPRPRAVQLKLYVTGDTVSARRAKTAITALVDTRPKDDFAVEVIDVLSHPETALRDNVYATPTLVCTNNGSLHRLVGDLSCPEKIEAGLQLKPKA